MKKRKRIKYSKSHVEKIIIRKGSYSETSKHRCSFIEIYRDDSDPIIVEIQCFGQPFQKEIPVKIIG